MFGILGAISVISILVGIFAHDTLGADLSGILVIGGAIPADHPIQPLIVFSVVLRYFVHHA